MRENLKKIVATGLVLGSAMYASYVLAKKVENTQERMPEIIGEMIKPPLKIRSKDGKIEVLLKEFRHKFRQIGGLRQLNFYLICEGVAEERPFSVYAQKALSNVTTDKLFLDIDRNGFIDSGGELTGKRMIEYTEKHRYEDNLPVINIAPKCK